MEIFGLSIKRKQENTYINKQYERICDMCGEKIQTSSSSGGISSNGLPTYGHHFCSNGELGNLR